MNYGEVKECEKQLCGGEFVNRNEQFEVLENLFTWDIEEVGHFTIAFFAHYQLLNDMVEKCAERFKQINTPRVDYLFYKEHIYAIYSELCVTIETLMKSLLEENGYNEIEIRQKGHNLKNLLNKLESIDTEKTNDIRTVLKKHQGIINYFVSSNIFVDTRYMTFKEEVSLLHINKIRGLIIDLDSIYEKYYKNFDWEGIVYPNKM